MIEAKYVKDYKYNYLILKAEKTGINEGYQQKILASGKLERILKCAIRNVNGAVYYYYDISSKVTLENLYDRKQMTYEQVRDFLEQMDFIYTNLASFFMKESSLLSDPKYIYYDINAKKYYGLYYPDKEAESENIYEPLMDFLLNHIDNEDTKLTDMVYRLYEMAETDFFSLSDALSLLEEEEIEKKRTEDVIDGSLIKEQVLEQAEKEKTLENGSFTRQGTDVEYEMLYGQEEEQNTKDSASKEEIPKAGRKKNNIFYGIFALLSLCGMGGEFWLYQTYALTQQENMMIIGCMALTALCFLFAVMQLVLTSKRERTQAREDTALQREIEDEFRDMPSIPIKEVLSKDMGRNAFVQTDAFSQRKRNDTASSMWKESGQELYEETVFIDLKKQNTGAKLYALDKKNKKHIELTKFPFTIGKMAGSVDCVLMDNSISRFHARIDKKEDVLFLTDMNSTNGTYKNGLRIEPNETIEMEVGDEIRFGKLNYCYR